MTIGIVGNPNCGKTTLFNLLTGAKQKVGNWPGVTVDRKTGSYSYEGRRVEVVDTPGIYSLSAVSVDEKVASGYVLSKEYDVIVNIVDASNIERNLYLTSQLLEMKVPVVIALNMMDAAVEKALNIDFFALQEKLACWVIPMMAKSGKGLKELKRAILTAAQANLVSPVSIVYPDFVEKAARDLSSSQFGQKEYKQYDSFWLSIKLLEDDEIITKLVAPKVLERVKWWQEEIEEEMDEDADILIASARYDFIISTLSGVVKKAGTVSSTLSEKIDRIVLHKVFGLPIFFLSMYLMFMFTINIGGSFIDFFDILFGVVCVDWSSEIMSGIGVPDWLTTILGGGLGGALQTMATFIPPIGFMFLALSFLEDSGYMARAAFVMDRAMRVIGLPGKAFIPMLIGFGCNVPAIMASRTMENQRDRTLTVAMNPFMSCGARLPVYVLFIAVFFPASGQNLVFILYMIGIAFAVFTGLVLKNTLLKGEISQFVMELPPYHLPTVKMVFMHTFERLKAFLFKAGKVLIPVIVVLSFLNSMGTDGTFGNDDSENSVLSVIGKTITPLFGPMGIKEENWPATVGIFTGIFAKEAVVGTLDTLYETSKEAEDGGEGVDVMGGIGEAFATIPENLLGVAGTLLDPLGISVGDVSDADAAAEELEVSTGTFASMEKLFGEVSAAFAYLLFVLLYFPCSAAIAAVYRETNLFWTMFVGSWTTLMGYIAATLFYQGSTWSEHPISSSLWISGVMLLLVAILVAMRVFGASQRIVYEQRTVTA
ncbi:MAG: ferrous iron transporter B [Desulfobacterales bacterium]|nr:MAG: ferrous iron transporter B [Desulfobacterales bacterium]